MHKRINSEMRCLILNIACKSVQANWGLSKGISRGVNRRGNISKLEFCFCLFPVSKHSRPKTEKKPHCNIKKGHFMVKSSFNL